MKHHTVIRHTAFAIALAACIAGQRSATAQSNSLFGSRGPASQIGSNMNGSGAGFGTTQSGPTFTGLDGQTLGSGGQLTPPTGGNIVGRDDNAGRFVGDQRLGQFGQGGNPGRNSRDFGNRGNRNFDPRSGAGGDGRNPQRARATIRPRQRIAFSYPVRAAETVNIELTRQLHEIAKVQTQLAGVAVTIDESGVATITGMVDTPEQRRLAELFVRLEPGVRSVRNEMTVQGG